MIHVCTSDIRHMILGIKCLFVYGGVLSECQPSLWKHAFYSMFRSGLIPMGYALYLSLGLVLVLRLICGRVLADFGSSHVLM